MFSGEMDLCFQFGHLQIEAFDFLDGDSVDFTEQFDDPGLVCVHERIMTVTVAGDADAPPGGCGSL